MKAQILGLSAAALLAAASFASATDPSEYGLIRRSPWVHLEVVGGRLAATNLAAAPNRSLSEERADAEESLTINCTDDEAALSYKYCSPNREISFEQRGGRITVLDRHEATTLLYSQSPDEAVVLSIERGASKHQASAASLWHLLLIDQRARTELLPILSALEPNSDLRRQLAEIKQQLIVTTSGDWQSKPAGWRASLQDLAAADFPLREAADRRLRAGGSAAAAFLQSQDPASLDPEQRRRVARIVAAIHSRPDEPSSVAAALVYDRGVWCAMLRDDSEETRSLAAKHLAQLVGRSLAFDPLADGKIREAQVGTIEQTLLR